VDNLADKDAFVEALLQERDELYLELSKLRQADGGVEHWLRQKRRLHSSRKLLKRKTV